MIEKTRFYLLSFFCSAIISFIINANMTKNYTVRIRVSFSKTAGAKLVVSTLFQSVKRRKITLSDKNFYNFVIAFSGVV